MEQHIRIVSYKDINNIPTWTPASGWNASFFDKDKLKCNAYYYFFKNAGYDSVHAEWLALKKIFELKYGVSY